MKLAYVILIATLVVYFHARPCISEDSNVCTWYASLQGNGIGSNVTSTFGGHYFRW